MSRVYVTDSLEPPAQLENDVLHGLAEVVCLKCDTAEQLDEQVRDAAALIVYHESVITPRTIAGLQNCRVIVRGGVGYDNIDVAAATERGIPVCNIPDYGVDEVADQAIGSLIALNRGFIRAERRLRFTLSPWDRTATGPAVRLAEATLGIIGCGRIGSAVAVRARALKMRVVVYDPYLRPGMEKVIDVERVDLPTLLATSDMVSVHTPLTPETNRLIDANALSQMKPTALLINTARGAVVDTDAVADALRAGTIAGAAIDVLTIEPPDTRLRLIELWQDKSADVNLMITPHTAYYSASAIREIRTKGAAEVARVLRGERPVNCVNATR
ncbi:MAG: C-terminal binding protein [Planctomycetales bacterium]|nr:C-terminal binding protein [Planctomycetales bacterium]